MGGAEGLVPDEATVRKTLVDAARRMRRPLVLMSHTLGSEAGPSDSRLHLCDRDAPHEELLPRCAVVVHHGGVGTVIAALRAGIPQLVVPLAFDQPFWAQRVRELGVGDTMDLEELSVPALARALQRLLSSPD